MEVHARIYQKTPKNTMRYPGKSGLSLKDLKNTPYSAHDNFS